MSKGPIGGASGQLCRVALWHRDVELPPSIPLLKNRRIRLCGSPYLYMGVVVQSQHLTTLYPYPFITASGRSLATLRASPAPSTTLTTASMSL